MLNDEAASLRISGSPVHKRASKPNLGDYNPSVAAIAKYDAICYFRKNLTFGQRIRLQCLAYQHHAAHRRYAWDWLAILLLMVILVITEKLKPFEKSIYHEDDSVRLHNRRVQM